MSGYFGRIGIDKVDTRITNPSVGGIADFRGITLRHVKIREAKAIRSRALRRLLELARQHRMPEKPSE